MFGYSIPRPLIALAVAPLFVFAGTGCAKRKFNAAMVRNTNAPSDPALACTNGTAMEFHLLAPKGTVTSETLAKAYGVDAETLIANAASATKTVAFFGCYDETTGALLDIRRIRQIDTESTTQVTNGEKPWSLPPLKEVLFEDVSTFSFDAPPSKADIDGAGTGNAYAWTIQIRPVQDSSGATIVASRAYNSVVYGTIEFGPLPGNPKCRSGETFKSSQFRLGTATFLMESCQVTRQDQVFVTPVLLKVDDENPLLPADKKVHVTLEGQELKAKLQFATIHHKYMEAMRLELPQVTYTAANHINGNGEWTLHGKLSDLPTINCSADRLFLQVGYRVRYNGGAWSPDQVTGVKTMSSEVEPLAADPTAKLKRRIVDSSVDAKSSTGTVIASLSEGTTVTLAGTGVETYRVRRVGFIHVSNTSCAATFPKCGATVRISDSDPSSLGDASGTTFREGNASSTKSLGVLSNGTDVRVLMVQANKWLQVEFEGSIGSRMVR